MIRLSIQIFALLVLAIGLLACEAEQTPESNGNGVGTDAKATEVVQEPTKSSEATPASPKVSDQPVDTVEITPKATGVRAVATTAAEWLDTNWLEAERISYKELFRNIDLYEGKSYGFTGKVIQVLEGKDDNYQLRVSVTRERFNWSDTFYVFHEGIRLLEDDLVQFVGSVNGTITYKSTLGGEITIPELQSQWIKVIDESELAALGQVEPEPTSSVQTTSIPESSPDVDSAKTSDTSFGDGVWRVGADISAGIYASAASQGCYWQRMSGLSGSFSDILANNNTSDPTIVEILPTDLGFSSTRCREWILATDTPLADNSDGFVDGVWRVGIDIQPGTYVSDPSEGCYWQRTSGLSGSLSDVLANDNTSDPVIVEIMSTDVAFSSTRCGSWTLAVPSLGTPSTDDSKEFGDGTWRVGADIQPGIYFSEASEGCYWERLSGLSGSFSDVLANDNTDDRVIVEILQTDIGFESSRCGAWLMASDVSPLSTTRAFTDGVWRVGIDIQPGTYISEPSDGCYWQRTSGLSGSFSEVLANDNSDDRVIVNILPSDIGFGSSRCGDWEPAS